MVWRATLNYGCTNLDFSMTFMPVASAFLYLKSIG